MEFFGIESSKRMALFDSVIVQYVFGYYCTVLTSAFNFEVVRNCVNQMQLSFAVQSQKH